MFTNVQGKHVSHQRIGEIVETQTRGRSNRVVVFHENDEGQIMAYHGTWEDFKAFCDEKGIVTNISED